MKFKSEHFSRELNRAFGSPFLPKGFFAAGPRGKGLGKGLKLRIGDRDLEIDGKGHFVGSGFNVGQGKEWDVKRLER